jgi:hypothetical protein
MHVFVREYIIWCNSFPSAVFCYSGIKVISCLYGNQTSITTFNKACQYNYVPLANFIQFIYSLRTSPISISILPSQPHLELPSNHFPQAFMTTKFVMYSFYPPHMQHIANRAICLDLITLTMLQILSLPYVLLILYSVL